MKKTALCFIFVVMVNISVFGQNVENENAEKRFTIQTSPLLLMFDLIVLGIGDEYIAGFAMDLEGQYKINDIINISFTFSFSTGPIGWDINLKPMFVYRPLKTGLEGFYIGLYPTIGWYSLYDDLLSTNIGVGLDIGYKWVFNSGFTFQIGTGICKS